MLELMKASAGSGKTYTLAKKYIALLLGNNDREAYRHILAVTFTNKATDEMKSRILKELFIMATEPLKSDYYKDFVPSVLSDEERLKMKSAQVLSDILHDYSAFSVSTIDKFFQQTLKAFAHEIGQFASYQVELDRDSVVEESVDRLLDTLTEDKKELREWLTENLLDQLERGGKYRVDASLMDIAKRLGSRQRKDAVKEAEMDRKSVDKENLKSMRTSIRNILKDGRDGLISASEAILAEVGRYGISVTESKRTFLGHFACFAKVGKGEFIEMPSDSFLSKLDSPDKWFTAEQKKKFKTSLGDISSAIAPEVSAVADFFSKDIIAYNTACILDSQLYGLGLAGELDQMFKEIIKEKNIMCLDDSNEILRDIINGSDAPFIYEKTGLRYDHFLLDEFQDTSRVQYDNFLPLLRESDANGGKNLIVGDVKQSIYRWRGSDWNLLNKEIRGHFDDVTDDSLDTNWRSLKNVVEFNNTLFKTISMVLDCENISQDAVNEYKSVLEKSPEKMMEKGPMSEIYSDVEQKVAPKHKAGGSVDLTFVPSPQRGSNEPDLQMVQILSRIDSLKSQGARLSDIAVLVRGNAEGEKIASALLENSIAVITDESLKVKKSSTVRKMMSLMSYVDNPADKVNGYLAGQLNISMPSSYRSLIDLAEYFLRELKLKDGEGWKNEIPHIQSYMDAVQEYVSAHDNSLHNFLKYWEEKDPSISSPSAGDAVRIMTVHKSKGLAFPYVILPYAEKISFYKSSRMWCSPALKGTPLEGVAEGVYDVMLSEKTGLTSFSGHYDKERFMQLVDNINILYVALTRAEKGMHIIADAPSKSRFDNISSSVYDFKSFSELIFWFVSFSEIMDGIKGWTEKDKETEKEILHFSYGEKFDFAHMKRDFDEVEAFVPSDGNEFPSIPLNPSVPVMDSDDEMVDVREIGRLKFSMDSLDFFSDGKAGIDASPRLRGIVLHDILSRVSDPSDLDAAVDVAVDSGDIDMSQRDEFVSLLKERMESRPEWFASEGLEVLNEATLIDTDGNMYRPDRVVISAGGAVRIVDYKFGDHHRSYERQLSRYADLWRRMGYNDVTATLWYVHTGEIVQVV